MSSYDPRDIDPSFSDGIWYSFRASIGLSIILSFFITLITRRDTVIEFIAYLFGITCSMIFFSGIITFLVTSIIAYPSILILKFYKLDNEINSALIGGLIPFIFLMWGSSGYFISSYYIVILYGIVSGYYFFKGYKRALQ